MTTHSTRASGARLGRIRRRGVTLIEAVLYISIALALIVGGIGFFQQASVAQRTNNAVRNISALASEVRALYSQANTFEGLDTTVMIRSGSVPTSLVDDSVDPPRLKNEWSNPIRITAFPGDANESFTIDYIGVPEAACVRIMVIDFAGNGRIGSGIRRVGMRFGEADQPDNEWFYYDLYEGAANNSRFTAAGAAALCRNWRHFSHGSADLRFVMRR